MLRSKPCSDVSGRKIGSCVPSWKISRVVLFFLLSYYIPQQEKSLRDNHPTWVFGWSVLFSVGFRLVWDVWEGQCRGPYSATTSSFDAPVVERERGGTTLEWEQGWGLLETAMRAASLPCHLGFLVCVVWGVLLAFPAGKVVCSVFTLFFRPGPSGLHIMNANGPGFSLWWFRIPCDSRAQNMWFIG